MKERIIEMLGNGLSSTDISIAVGCDISYVSQIAGDEENKSKIAEMRAARAQQYVERDKKIEQLEDLALAKIERLMPMQTDVMKLGKLFQIMNSAKKLSQAADTPNSNTAPLVQIQITQAAAVALKLTTDQQVIEVDGRSMVPMQSHMVAAKLRDMKAARLLTQPGIPLDAKNGESKAAEPKMISNRTKSIVDQL